MAERKKTDIKKLVTRRDFLVAGGAVIAAGALSACTPKTTTETVVNTVTNTKTVNNTLTNTTTQTAPAQTTTVTGAPVTTTKTATTTATVTGTPVTTTKTTQVEKLYEVVMPLAEREQPQIKMAPRLSNLQGGKTIAVYQDNNFGSPVTAPKIRELLVKNYPDIKALQWDGKVDFLTAQKVDAVISGNGG